MRKEGTHRRLPALLLALSMLLSCAPAALAAETAAARRMRRVPHSRSAISIVSGMARPMP